MELKAIIALIEEALKTNDIEIICNKIEQSGFRLVYIGSAKNFDNYKFGSKLFKRIACKNNPLGYSAEIETNERYKDIIFVNVYKENFNERFNVFLPSDVMAFTNAPITTQFKKLQSNLVSCERCKKTIIKNDTHFYNGKFYCPFCYELIMKNDARQYEKDHPEEFEKFNEIDNII